MVTAVAALPAFQLHMLNLKECRNELTKNGEQHTDEEIVQIRDLFVEMSNLIIKTIKAENNEKGNIVC